MVWKNAFKVVFAAGEAVAKAFSKAVREEINASKQAASRYAESSGASANDAQKAGETNARLGISLQESIQILNVKEPLQEKEVLANYKHLFEVNDKSKGGSLYLQSKVYRAKERLDEEFMKMEETPDSQTETQKPEEKSEAPKETPKEEKKEETAK